MKERIITLRDILRVTKEEENICLNDEEGEFVVNIKSEKAKRYLSRIILGKEVEKVEGISGNNIKVTLKKGQKCGAISTDV